jgi:hypothetical protein
MAYESIEVYQKEGPTEIHHEPKAFSYSSSGVIIYVKDKDDIYHYYMTHNVFKVIVKDKKDG